MTTKLTKKVAERKLRQYAEWYALPDEDKDPKTQAEMARKLNVSEQTLITWKSKLTAPDGVDEIEHFKERLYQMATKINATAKHMELYARLQGLLVEKREETIRLELSADERYRRNKIANRELEEGH